MKITIIAAVARNLAIGKDNKLIYRLPDDMKRFKALTTGNTVIMGRNTFESLPKGALPNRRNIVLSRTKSDFPGCDTFGRRGTATLRTGGIHLHNRRGESVRAGHGTGRPPVPHRD